MREKVTRQCPQTTIFKEKGEPKRIWTEHPLLASLTAWPNRLTSSIHVASVRINLPRLRSPHTVQELCESRGGRPGLSVLTSLLVSVDVKNYWTALRHWSQLVPNMSVNWHLRTDTKQHFIHHLTTLRASPLSGTFLQTRPELVTPLWRGTRSLSPRSCPLTLSAPSDRFQH